MIETAPVIDFVFRRANENMVVPFVAEIPDVADGYVNAFVLRAFDESGKAKILSWGWLNFMAIKKPRRIFFPASELKIFDF